MSFIMLVLDLKGLILWGGWLYFLPSFLQKYKKFVSLLTSNDQKILLSHYAN